MSGLEAELRAIGLAAEMATKKKWEEAVIVSDCKVVRSALVKKRSPDWKLTDTFLRTAELLSKIKECSGSDVPSNNTDAANNTDAPGSGLPFADVPVANNTAAAATILPNANDSPSHSVWSISESCSILWELHNYLSFTSERKEQIEKAEEKERLQREKEEKEKKEAEEKTKHEGEAKQEDVEGVEKPNHETETINTDDDKIGLIDDPPSDQDAVETHDGLAAEAEHIDASKNEKSLIEGVEQHTTQEIEESATMPETGTDVGSKVSPDEVKDTGGNDASENTEGLSREELGRLVASRWTGENTGKQTEDTNAKKDNNNNNHEAYEDTEEMPKDTTHDEEDDGYASETDDEHHKYDESNIEDELEDDMKEDHDIREEDPEDSSSSYKYDSDVDSDFSDVTTSSNPSWLETIQQKVRSVLQVVNLFQTPVNQSDAARIRKEYDESSNKLSKIQSRISSLTQKLKHDFGVEKEFYSFYGQCFEGKENKYVYRVCPYKQASQVDGHSTTRLGQWDKFEESYRMMIFSNGDKCWNGPDRSLKVRLRCGLKNEVTDVDEPSRCEYVALLSTPAVCVESRLKELQQKLDLMNREQPQNHDEL
ncbi:hypothetical protein F8388_003573 [Cannabis sativa]|uniref:MRH domain-containing protein n=1 Tax=Cannabis sativa TaxID=3483 RepID=A0A7J6EPG8_CANSA|nr:hypothetical protein F8388_003573 [Cannabis sativa]KAF4377979.1 hypothetical protein G4B88_004586 [Cannabis sativa]